MLNQFAIIRPRVSDPSGRSRRADARLGPARRAPAFSMLELVVVLVIVSTVATMGILRYWSSLAKYRIEGASNRLIADVASVRAQARNSSADRVLRFYPARSAYATRTRAQDLADQDGPVVELSDPPYHATFGVLGMPGNQIRFDRFGASDAGGIVTIRVGNQSAAVIIEPGTGRAYVAGRN